MGEGYTKTCDKCGYTFSCYEGVGFLFPMVYKETVQKAKAGKMGKTLKNFFDEHPDGAIEVVAVTLCCDKCGDLRGGIDLTMYIPKGEIPERSKDDCWCPTFPFSGEEYVTGSELEEYYEKYADYPHKCGKCKGRMHVVKDSRTLLCPNCKEPLRTTDTIMWD